MSDHDQRIRESAYHIWERAGRPEGRHNEHWRQAKEQLDASKGPDLAGREAAREYDNDRKAFENAARLIVGRRGETGN
jgi:hypothetical protein